jgi:hypothetical protein
VFCAYCCDLVLSGLSDCTQEFITKFVGNDTNSFKKLCEN